MYLGLSGATAIYYIYDRKGKGINTIKIIIGAGIIPALYGGFIEYLQGKFFAPRTADWYDFWADVAGVAAGLLLAYLFKHFMYKRTTSEV